MDSASDLIEYFRLDAEFCHDCVKYVGYRSSQSRGHRKVRVERKWVRQRNLSTGVCGTVVLQSDHRGETRVVKAISKEFYVDARIDYRRELVAMARLTKVCDAVHGG